MTRARQVISESLDIETASDYIETPSGHIETPPESIMGGSSHNYRVTPTTRRVCTKRSPHLKVFYHHHAQQLTIDTSAEISMIKALVARQVGAIIHKTRQTALQADGITPLTVVGEVHFNVNRDHWKLDVDILAGTPFMALNDISVRPSLQQISIQGSHILYYGAEGPDPPQNHVRRTQSHVRASPSSTVIWPGEYIDIQLPPQVHPDSILALEPHPDCARSTRNWPHPNIVEAVAGHVRILNDTTEPQHLARHEHFVQVLPTLNSDVSIVDNTLPPAPPPPHQQNPSTPMQSN